MRCHSIVYRLGNTKLNCYLKEGGLPNGRATVYTYRVPYQAQQVYRIFPSACAALAVTCHMLLL
jgi:hypothetical protein